MFKVEICKCYLQQNKTNFNVINLQKILIMIAVTLLSMHGSMSGSRRRIRKIKCKNFLQEKAVEATKQKRRKEEKT
jgi:hypothetical protein